MTPGYFLQGFPEFRQTDPELVAAKLLLASARMGGPDVTVWGPFAVAPPVGAPTGAPYTPTIADLAQGNLAAHYLVTSPFGTSTAQGSADGRTSYLDVFEELCDSVAGGVLVSGVVI